MLLNVGIDEASECKISDNRKQKDILGINEIIFVFLNIKMKMFYSKSLKLEMKSLKMMRIIHTKKSGWSVLFALYFSYNNSYKSFKK